MRRTLLLASLAALLSVVTPLSAEDALDGLRNAVFQARSAIASLRTGDFRLRGELTLDLDAAQQALDALAARAATGAMPAPAEVAAIRQRIEEARRRARSTETVTGQGLGPSAVAGPAPTTLQPLDLPAGTPARIQLLQRVDPATSQPGDIVEAVVVDAVTVQGRIVAPVGALLRGAVADVAGHTRLALNQIQIGYASFLVGGGTALPSEAVLSAGSILRVELSPPARATDRR